MACVQCSTRQDDLTHVHTVTVKLGLFHVSVSQQQEGRRPISCQRGTLIRLLEILLKCNIFEFNSELFLQLLGTAMGTRAAVSYANHFTMELPPLPLSRDF